MPELGKVLCSTCGLVWMRSQSLPVLTAHTSAVRNICAVCEEEIEEEVDWWVYYKTCAIVHERCHGSSWVDFYQGRGSYHNYVVMAVLKIECGLGIFRDDILAKFGLTESIRSNAKARVDERAIPDLLTWDNARSHWYLAHSGDIQRREYEKAQSGVDRPLGTGPKRGGCFVRGLNTSSLQ